MDVASAVTVPEIIDLDVGAALGLPFDANVQAVNDSGWVFIGDDLRRRGLVWLDDANGAYLPGNLKPLPTELRWLGEGTMTDAYNGRGDYLPHRGSSVTADQVVMADGNGGWVLGQPLAPPAGFVAGQAYAWGINDSRLVVGHGTNPARTYKTKWSTYVFDSPVAWTVNSLGQAITVTALPIPVASTGCFAGHVRATAVNDNGVIIGYSEEYSVKTGTFCPRQAVLWPSATSTPILLPRTTAVPGYSPKVKSQDISFEALHVNNAGVVVGRVHARNMSGSQRVARWRPVGSGYGLPEFHGDFFAFPAALDECGRVAIDAFGTNSYTAVWGADPNDAPVRLPVPEGFTYPSGALWDIVSHPGAGDFVVGEASHPASDPFLGDHVLMWKLGACGQ
jgi:hypothetical protein